MLLIMARRCPWGMSRVMPCHAVRTHSRIVLFRLLQVLLLTGSTSLTDQSIYSLCLSFCSRDLSLSRRQSDSDKLGPPFDAFGIRRLML
ncbi:hypothetical protein V6N12_048233 [Hibiscus sabdariffa]|uniref:Secreted protein n=1 Tax=Hibiscus sabdariffa TaxID=183260 RepID=A0ABR2EGN2_9ROSI